MDRRTRIELILGILGVAFCLSAPYISKHILPAPDIGEPLRPGWGFKNLCPRWAPPECFKDRFKMDYRADEPVKPAAKPAK